MENGNNFTRRDFLIRASAAAVVASAPGLVHGQGSDKIKIGLIGCGGRGTGAASDALTGSEGVEIYAMGDVFEDRLKGSYQGLKDTFKERINVAPSRMFTGFDAYQSVIASGVDMVILATPPGFRPVHFAAAVEAGKHVFMEKPVAVDAEGVRSVLASAEIAKRKNLGVVSGTQRRHDLGYLEAMKRIHGGQIGDVVALYAYWNQGSLWMNPRQESWSDMEWQLKNWLYFTWLSGDHICEQHIHNLDVCNWAMKDQHPIKATCLGGREVRTDPAYGHIFDHFATEYEYANGVKLLSMCRQIDGTASRVSEHIVGTKGTSNANTSIKDHKGKSVWKWDGDRPNPYVLEHRDLVKSIRAGKPLNEAKRVAESTMTAILGRLSAYSGKEVTWDQAMASKISLMPTNLKMDMSLEVPPVAIPGRTNVL